ncbi:Pentapeptide repeats (9 copies) [uncultured archaeon]|nr:Pentapeptide repeats (9 copies) [uncultured archaeon]
MGAGGLRERILDGSLVLLLLIAIADGGEPARVVQAEEILKLIELGQPVEYDGCTIEGDLDLRGLDLPRVPVDRTWLEESLSLPDYFILGVLDYDIIVASPISISNSVIKGSVNLNGTVFQNSVVFHGNRFEGPAFLVGSKFNQADFSDTQFNRIADFSCAQFNQTDFTDTQFNETANFWCAQFNETAFFTGAQFNEIAGFSYAQFNRTAYFRNVQFNQEAQFLDADFLDLSFDNSQFSKDPFFDNAQIKGHLSLYRTKYDKLNIRWSSIHDLTYDDTAYFLLIENFKKLGFTDNADECYYSYRYKHMWELLRQGKFDSWFFDLLAWATYGYGLRPVRPLGWSMFFILAGGSFFFFTKSIRRSMGRAEPSGNRMRAIRGRESKQEQKDVSIWEAFLLSATYFTSGASAIISGAPMEFAPIGKARYVVVLLRLLGWVFFVIFLSSLTRSI